MTSDATNTQPAHEFAPVESLSFEQAQAELESVVEQLENEQTGLEDALTLWERGEQLHTWCQGKLDYAAARLEKVQVSADDAAAVVAEGGDDFVAEDKDITTNGSGHTSEPPSIF